MSQTTKNTETANAGQNSAPKPIAIDAPAPAGCPKPPKQITSAATTQNEYRYVTDSESGVIRSASLQSGYAQWRSKITPAMIEDGASLWVEDGDGNRITMRD